MLLTTMLIDSQRPRYETESESESDRSYRQRNRRKSTTGAPRDVYHDRSESRDGSGDDESRNHNTRGWANSLRDKGGQLIVQAALPLIAAGAAEALRSRKQPGEWKGDKGKHVVKAAVSNGLINKDPSKPHAHHIVDTTVSGLKDGHPSRDELAEIQRRAGGRRTVSNAKKIAAAGAIAFAGIEIYDRYGRSRSLKRSESSEDNFAASKKRSQSVSDRVDQQKGSRDLEEDGYRVRRGQYTDDHPDQRRNYHRRDYDYRDSQYCPDEY